MTKPDKVASQQRAREVWDAMPQQGQTWDGLKAKIEALGYRSPNRATLFRWIKKWTEVPVPPTKAEAEVRAKATEPSVPVIAAPQFDPAALDAIPKELQDAVGLRVLFVARGKGLDRVENAIVAVADEIAKKASAIAEAMLEAESMSEATTTDADGKVISTAKVNKNVGEKAVAQLAVLAGAMREIVASRTMYSLAYRNYGEGDLLSGQAQKFRAEAKTLIEEGAAGRAKQIEGNGGQFAGPFDASEEDDALDALQEVEARVPK